MVVDIENLVCTILILLGAVEHDCLFCELLDSFLDIVFILWVSGVSNVSMV